MRNLENVDIVFMVGFDEEVLLRNIADTLESLLIDVGVFNLLGFLNLCDLVQHGDIWLYSFLLLLLDFLHLV